MFEDIFSRDAAHMLWVLIRIVTTYAFILCLIHHLAEAILMSTHNMSFMETYRKLSSNYHQTPSSVSLTNQMPISMLYYVPQSVLTDTAIVDQNKTCAN